MKKILLFFVALVATLSMNAQTTEIYNGNTKEATYYGADVTVKFGVAGEGQPTIEVYKGNDLMETYKGSDYKVVSKKLPPSTGTAKRTGNIDVNWVQLWKDGPKFAEYNVGATNNKATDYGHYLAWGGSSNKGATYNAGSADLSGSDDSAYNLWGEHWRMPTKDELQALIDSCDVKWTNSYNDSGMAGTIYTGRGDYSFNSIFLPAAGFHSSRDGKINNQGFYGSYWSSTPNGSDKAVSLDFNSSTPQMNTNRTRDYGCSVRPIYVEDIVAVTGISLDKTKLKVEGNTETLSATVTPADATNKKVLWTSSNEKVATVDAYGKVTGVASGNCVITATTEDGKKTATCAVEVVVLTTGTAKRTGNIDVNWVQLWAGGPKFAEYNVGVTDGNAKSYGGYYCWGKATDKDSQGAYKDGTSALSGDDDTATKLWGENWRMPTSAELQALLNNCNVELKDNYNGTAGLLCTGKENTAYSSNSIFLPAAGGCGYGSVWDQGEYGCYWSSTPAPDDEDGNKRAFRLDFSFVSFVMKWCVDSYPRDGGYSVRAVLAK